MINLSRFFEEFQKLSEYAMFNNGQKEFAREFFTGGNIFLSGSAGVGKSFVVKVIYDFLERRNVEVGKTALTGIAALNIGGMTIHSFAGVGLAQGDAKTLIEDLRKKPKAKERIATCKVLIIDEISMAKADLLDKLDAVFRYYRYNNDAFGGIKILFVGDLLQLAPIWKGDEKKDFCFNSTSWKNAKIRVIELTEIMRQRAGSEIAVNLNKIRVGDTDGLKYFKQRIGAEFPKDGIEPVIIFCKNMDVDDLNKRKLAALTTQSKTYTAKDDGQPYHTEQFNKTCPAPEVLELKVGAQVMLCYNLDTENGFVNGSVGVVQSFTTAGVNVKFQSGNYLVEEVTWDIKEQEPKLGGGFRWKVIATRTQMPLRLAYAITVHRSQGMTLDRAIVDMSDSFAEAMSYVALSRVRDINSLSIVALPANKVRANRECIEFYENLRKNA